MPIHHRFQTLFSGFLIGALWILATSCYCEDTSLLSIHQDSPRGFTLGLTRSGNKPLYYLQVFCEQINAQPEIEVVPNPMRIVIDFPGIRFAKNRTFEIKSDKRLKQLRFGSHAERGRIVLDIQADQAPEIVKTVTEKQHVITFGWDDVSTKAVGTATASATPSPNPTPSQSAFASQVPTSSITPAPSLIKGGATIDAINSASATALADIVFQPATRSVIVKMTQPSTHTFSRRDLTSFVLTLSSCAINDRRLAAARFPEGDFPHFRFAQGRAVNGTCEVVIGVDPNTELKAAAQGTTIEIK